MVHESAGTSYERQADVCAAIRPTYHPDRVARFVNDYASGVIVDIGAGNGIFASQLVEAIPGLRTIPYRLKLYLIIWRDFYDSAESPTHRLAE